jgi:general secretion pathway protein C
MRLASSYAMLLGRTLLNYAVPVAVAATAFLNAHTLSTLVGTRLAPDASLVALPVANAATAAPSPTATGRPSADAILDRNPFDHTTSLRVYDGPVPDPMAIPACAGIRPLVLVASEDPRNAFAAFDVGGKRIVRRTGSEIDGKRLAFVGRESVWLESAGTFCQAKLFGARAAPPPPPGPGSASPPGATQSPLEKALASKVERVSATEFHLDRSAVDLLFDAQTELMKLRLAPDKDGDRVVGMRVFGVKPGSALALLGIESNDRLETIAGIEVSSPEKMLEMVARLKSGSMDRLTIHLTRGGRGMNVDYVVR